MEGKGGGGRGGKEDIVLLLDIRREKMHK